MPRECFEPKKFSSTHEYVIAEAIRICREMQQQGYTLTLRQVYYQFVGHDLFPDEWQYKSGSGGYTKNDNRNYKKLGKILSAARRAGVLDWDAFGDRTRNFRGRAHWDSLGEFLRAQRWYYTIDYWVEQEVVPEVWVEKDALINVVGTAARGYDVTTFSSRGYPSDSALYEAAQRIKERWEQQGQITKIIHLADHDPSGVDMSRAIQDTLELFDCYEDALEVKRIALNIEQTHGLPPNFAKATDTRTSGYVSRFGTTDAWELDAIQASTLGDWIIEELEDTISDPLAFEGRKTLEKEHREKLTKIADRFDREAEE